MSYDVEHLPPLLVDPTDHRARRNGSSTAYKEGKVIVLQTRSHFRNPARTLGTGQNDARFGRCLRRHNFVWCVHHVPNQCALNIPSQVRFANVRTASLVVMIVRFHYRSLPSSLHLYLTFHCETAVGPVAFTALAFSEPRPSSVRIVRYRRPSRHCSWEARPKRPSPTLRHHGATTPKTILSYGGQILCFTSLAQHGSRRRRLGKSPAVINLHWRNAHRETDAILGDHPHTFCFTGIKHYPSERAVWNTFTPLDRKEKEAPVELRGLEPCSPDVQPRSG